MPLTFRTFLISTLAIAGISAARRLLLEGRDPLEGVLEPARPPCALGSSALRGAALTAFYMFRQVFMTFFGECRADHHTQEHLHESPPAMTVPLVDPGRAGGRSAGSSACPHALHRRCRPAASLVRAVAARRCSAGTARSRTAHAPHERITLDPLEYAADGALGRRRRRRHPARVRSMYLTAALSPETVQRARRRRARTGWSTTSTTSTSSTSAIFVRGTLLLARARGLVRPARHRRHRERRRDGRRAVVAARRAVRQLRRRRRRQRASPTSTWFVGGRVRRLQTGGINAYLYVVVRRRASAVVLSLLTGRGRRRRDGERSDRWITDADAA